MKKPLLPKNIQSKRGDINMRKNIEGKRREILRLKPEDGIVVMSKDMDFLRNFIAMECFI